MKFLVDAQLPERLATKLRDHGHDAIHTLDLPEGNRTRDRDITTLADEQGRVVVTKDTDFRDSHLLSGEPERLLIVATGNIRNADLLALFEAHLDEISDFFAESSFVELRADRLVAH